MRARSDQHLFFMQEALLLAEKGLYSSSPNPRVGCVIVKDDDIISRGFHAKAGQAHAEKMALNSTEQDISGSTVYVTLEPCCHFGRTSACTQSLIKAKVSQVIIATRDPNPLVAGKGITQLLQAGIDVVEGVLEKEARWLNRGFFSRMRYQKPWITLKSASTLDGRVADFNNESQWITGAAARKQVHFLRAKSCAVLTGIGTILADDPQMNVRISAKDLPKVEQPDIVILDSELRIPLTAKVLTHCAKVIIFTTVKCTDKIASLSGLGVQVVVLKKTQQRMNLFVIFTELAKFEYNEVLIEAGGILSGQCLDSGKVDELMTYVAPSVLGDQAQAMFRFDTPLSLSQRITWKTLSAKLIGNDIALHFINEQSKSQLYSE